MRSSKPILCQKRSKLKPAQLAGVYAALRKVFGHQNWWPGETPFEVMVGAILTQNTAWTHVEKAILNLRKAKMLSFAALRSISQKELAQLIRPAGYFNVKADRLRCFMEFLDRECCGDLTLLKRAGMPVLRKKLLAVKGIGPETADSILLYALRKRSFVIDTYTRRIFSRHGLAPEQASYETWREIFTQALPPDLDLFNDYHAQIVRTAKTYCRKVPRCEGCPLNRYF